MGIPTLIWSTSVDFIRDYCSIAGLNNAAKGKSMARVLYWLVIFAIGTYFTAVSVWELSKDYYSNPVVTSTDLIPSKSVYFPAVTVCNLNRIHCRSLYSELVRLQQLDGNPDVQILQTLFLETGCKTQICTVLEYYISDIREEPDYDELVLNLGNLDCIDRNAPEDKIHKLCYHLGSIILDESVENDTKTAAINIWNASNCTEDLACSHEPHDKDDYFIFYTYFSLPYCVPKSKGPDGGFKPPDLSKGATTSIITATGSPHTKALRRKRRQISVGGDNNNYDDDNEKPHFFEVNADFVQDDKFLREFMKLKPETRKKIGHQFEDKEDSVLGVIFGMIKDCTYSGGSCTNKSMWLETTVPGFGNCFTFNSALGGRTAINTTLTGNKNGLSIELFIDQSNYMLNKLSKKAGIRLVIHHPSSIPMADEFGMDLEPNTASSVAVQMNDVQRMPAPFESNCTDVWSGQGFNESWYSDNLPDYSVATCQRHCMQLDVIRSCGCFHINLDLDLINITRASFPNGTRTCSLLPNATNVDYTCFKPILDQYAVDARSCACNFACREVAYDCTISSSTWPSDQYWLELAKEIFHDDDRLKDEDVQMIVKGLIQRDYLKAEVYFKSLNVKVVNQTAKYSSDSFFAGVGGALGFYSGIALIMIFEIIELLWEIFEAIWKHLAKTKGM